jgi:hypothetical protein
MAPACPLCDAPAARFRSLEARSEVECWACGDYSITHEASEELLALSGAGRAVVGEAMRRHIRVLRENPGVTLPMILAEDIKRAAGRRVQ